MDNSSAQEPRPYAGYRILVADDNAINCQIARHMLEHLGCEVDIASCGEDVLSRHDKQAYALILLDCQMPGLDGYAVCRILRSGEADESPIPIIGWTAHVHQEEIEKCRSAGMNGCLPKPLRPDELDRMLGRWLNRRSPVCTLPHPADASGLATMYRISGDGFAELVNMFEEDMPQRLSDLANALQARDYLFASRTAHLMSGCCASIGAMHLSELCHQLERQANSCRQKGLQEMLAEIESSYQQICLTLHAMLAEAPSTRNMASR